MRENNRTKQTGTEKREIRHYNSSRNKIIQIHTQASRRRRVTSCSLSHLIFVGLLVYTAVAVYTIISFTQSQNGYWQDLRLLAKGYSKKDFAESARKEDLLPIFFLNLDKSTDRLDTLWKDFDALPDFLSSNLQLQRVPAVSTAAVESMLENNVLRFNEGITLTYSKRVSTNTGGQYTFNEAACTLSHLKAIWQAYDAGHEMVLIIEDHVMLTSDFFENWKAYAELAPDDWQILQWTTGNVAINKRELYKNNDYWISWKPTHYGAIAYTIRREGMKRILDHTHVTDTHNGGTSFDRWEFNEPNILVSDELIYYLAQNVYTSTFPWISTKKVASTMGEYHLGNYERDLTFGRSTVPISINTLNIMEIATK
jgi:GR25 family glycosyltransferase involved in LPS biosynthesis